MRILDTACSTELSEGFKRKLQGSLKWRIGHDQIRSGGEMTDTEVHFPIIHFVSLS